MTIEEQGREQATADPNKELRDSIDDLVDAMVEGEEAEYQNDLEPYDQHVQKIRQEMHETMDDFIATFLEGYELIMEELSVQYSPSGQSRDAPPPGAIKI